MIKVSVIIPTYCSGPRLDEAIASLDRQSMPQDEFEILLLDDGSPDDTFSRLRRIEAERPNVRAFSLEASGWPGRPRNIGVGEAHGEYVLFMDHDDKIYPDGLRAGYDLAAECDADILNGKETKTGRPNFALDTHDAPAVNSGDALTPQLLVPMTPHKLYRRDFLLDNGIEFPEDKRHFWEDIVFNVAAYRQARVIAVLNDTAFYHWVRYGEKTGSSSYQMDSEEYWFQLDRLFAFINQTLAGEEFREARESLLVYPTSGRILGRLGNRWERGMDEVIPTMQSLVQRHIPAELDVRFPAHRSVRMRLLRQGRADLLKLLDDTPTAAVSQATDVRWDGSILKITARTRWRTDDGTDSRLRLVDDHVVYELPREVTDVVPDSLADLDDEVNQARAAFSVKNMQDQTVWMLDSTSTPSLEVGGIDEAPVTVDVSTQWDVSAPGVRDIGANLWDFRIRAQWCGRVNHRVLRTELPARAALLDGVAAIVHDNGKGFLRVDVGQKSHTVLGASTPRWPDAVFTRGRRGALSFSVPLDDVEVVGETVLDGTIRPSAGRDRLLRRVHRKLSRRPVPARSGGAASIIGRDGCVHLVGSINRPRFNVRVRFSFGGKKVDPQVRLVRRGRGDLAFEPDDTIGRPICRTGVVEDHES